MFSGLYSFHQGLLDNAEAFSKSQNTGSPQGLMEEILKLMVQKNMDGMEFQMGNSLNTAVIGQNWVESRSWKEKTLRMILWAKTALE